MSITVNDAGTLCTLSAVTVNDGGTLRSLNTVWANDSGTLREIFSALPSAISGAYTSTVPPSNGNSTVPTTANAETVATVTLSRSATVTVNLSNISYGKGASNKVAVAYYNNSTVIGSVSSTGATSAAFSVTLSAGTYSINLHVFSVTGSQSGVTYYGGSCNYAITFS